MSEPMNPTAEEMFQEFLREFAKSAIEAYQYFDAEYGNNGDDQSRDAAIAAVMDEGHLGPDMFAGTGFYIIREQRDALKKQVQVLTKRASLAELAASRTRALLAGVTEREIAKVEGRGRKA